MNMKPHPLIASLALVISSCGGGGGGGGGTQTLIAQVVTSNAVFPTALRFLPNGDILFTEKNTGNVRKIVAGNVLPTPVFHVDVSTGGERGLLGLAIDPNYNANGFVYIFYSKSSGTENEVLRFTDVANVGSSPTVIVPSLPASANHDGGRIEFGPDGKLYVSLGDVQDPANAQSNSSPAGKILRYNSDGTIPGDNPIPGNPLYTKGHRNCFGIAIDSSGVVFVSENGPGCDDEVNRLVPGGNYGWRPSQPCGDTDPSYIQPLLRISNVVAPTGIAIGQGAYQESLLMASFNDSALTQIRLSAFPGGTVTGTSVLYTSPNQRILDVTMGPDGNPYVATTDFVGGQILRLVP
jgi:glucose/arabinose dehydrogenase